MCEPRRSSLGLQQGTVLSPLLFNIYTICFHDNFGYSVKTLQYVDDFCVYVRTDSWNESLIEVRRIIYCPKRWLEHHNFELCERKSGNLVFSCHRLQIPVAPEMQYLGVVLDWKLLWTKHIQHVIGRCQ